MFGTVQQVEDLILALSADEHYAERTCSQPKCSEDSLVGVRTVRDPDTSHGSARSLSCQGVE